MEEKGADPLGNAAECLAINSQSFIAALLPSVHSITALTKIVSGTTCTVPFCSHHCCGLVACVVLSTGLLVGCS